MTTPHPFIWLYREGDHRNNMDFAAGLLKIVCEVNIAELDDQGHFALTSLLRATADVINITQQQTAPQA